MYLFRQLGWRKHFLPGLFFFFLDQHSEPLSRGTFLFVASVDMVRPRSTAQVVCVDQGLL